MPQSPCWPRDTLKDYLNGSADDQRLEAIETHLAECQTCEQTLLELERDPDTLVEAVRAQTQELPDSESQANSEIGLSQSVINRAVEAVRQLGGTTSAPSGPLEKPGQIRMQQIGAYELLRPLGRGGMGLVLLARHSTLKKQVAIKILPSLIGDRPELVRRFEREIITAGQLNHPAIVHATDAGAEQGTHYLVMEFIDGLDLSRIARLGGPLSMADACELMRQAALGLSYAHAQGVVHRDVKPSNLMLDTSGRVKILDFGLAQLNLWEEAAVELTTVGQLMGTLDYMAPEQAERVGPVDYRADLYALGATLFRLLTGRAPLAASPNMTLLEKVRLLGSETPPLVSTLRDDCPNDLVRLIQQLLSRDPVARPASAAHVAEALLPFCDGHNLTTLLTRCRERATAEPALDETPVLRPLAAETPPVKPPRRSWLTLAWLAPLAIWAGVVILLETQKGQLVIESDVAGVKVNVLQDGKVYQQLQVQTGAQSTRLLADKYAIEIDGASDEVAIDQSKVEIRRGDTVVARIRQKSKTARTDLDLSHVYDWIGAGDVVEKNKAPSQSNLPQDLQIASLEVETARARLDQQKKEADAQKAELAQKTYEYEQVTKLYPQGLTSELEYNVKRNSMEQAKSKLQKAEAQAAELAMTLSAKELILESKVNAAAIKNQESSPGATIAAQPMYAGQTLSQWLDVLERDLDSKTRLETLPAIVKLAGAADSRTRERISHALVSVINSLAGQVKWSSDGIRHRPLLDQSITSLVSALISINGHQAAFTHLREGCLLQEGQVTPSTFVILYSLNIVARQQEQSEALAWQWLLDEGRFQSLDETMAWLAFAYIQDRLPWEDEAFYKAIPELIANQPRLGLRALCVLKNTSALAATQPEWNELEENIASKAREAFMVRDATPQLVALAATRLAATTTVDSYRAELLGKLKERLVALAQDRERLLAAAPRVNPPAPPGVSLTISSPGYWTSGGLQAFRLESVENPNQPVSPDDQPVGSELASLLVLAARLNAVLELAEPLALAAAPIFEAALPLERKLSGELSSKVSALKWPFDQDQLRSLPKPLNEFSPASWRATKLAATLETLPTPARPLFNTQLYALLVDYLAELELKRDTNGDRQLSQAEFGWKPRMDLDDNRLVTKEELINYFQEKDMREYVQVRFGDFVRFRDTSGPPNYLTKQDKDVVANFNEAQFAEMDTNHDERVTLDEFATYGMKYPKRDDAAVAAPSNAKPPTSLNSDLARAPNADDLNKLLAQRQLDKYDKNKDGQLTADEWSVMVIKPKEGADANGDGVITLEEFAASRANNGSTPAPKVDPNIPKPDSSSTPIYEGKTLEQWLQIFENDLSLPSRLAALTSVRMFTKNMTAEAVHPITQRILTATDAYLLEHAVAPSWRDSLASYTRDGRSNFASNGLQVRDTPNSPAPRVLSYMKSQLSEKHFLEFVKEKLSSADPKLAAHWMYGVCWNQQDIKATPYDQLLDWLLEAGRFKSLDPQVARLAVLYFELQMGKNIETPPSEIERIISEVRSHPSVGIDESLQFEPLTRGQSRAGVYDLQRLVDTVVVNLARQALASDDATPTTITLAACRLATSRSPISDFRAELIPVVSKRLQTIAQQPERLLAKLPMSHGEFYGTWQSSLLLGPITQQSFGLQSFINSEALALLSLVERLKMAKEVERELTGLLAATSSAAIDVETKTKVTMPAWSWSDVDLQDENASTKVDLPLTHWTVAAINHTIEEIRRRAPATLASGPLAEAKAEQLAKTFMLKFDSDHDGQLNYAERQASGSNFAEDDKSSSWTSDRLKQAFIEQLKAKGLSLMNYAIAMIKEKDKDGDGQLSIKEDSRWLAETFAEIDTNGDGQLSMEEYASKAARDDEDRKRMQGQSNNR